MHLSKPRQLFDCRIFRRMDGEMSDSGLGLKLVFTQIIIFVNVLQIVIF